MKEDVGKIDISAVDTQIGGFLLGKVLTIVDASYTDPVQREAVKSLIKDKFHSQLDWLLERTKMSFGSVEEK